MSAISAVEKIKQASHGLRGTLVESLADAVTGALAEDDQSLIKFHGSYQQDDRDLRDERRRAKLEPAYSFMIRTRLPGGVATPQQWLALDELATRYANGTLRLTTRQAFQLHGVVKRNLKSTIAAMNRVLVDTIAACGDVNRNVMATVVPARNPVEDEVLDWARKLSEHLLPKTRAYHEIWLDGEKVEGVDETETFYGPTYLPRKFKAAVALPPFNDVDVFAQDLGFIAIVEQGRLVGFNLTAGGGMGSTHGEAATYPRLADVIGFLRPEHLLEVAEAVVTTQRDFGDRTNRKHARLKYTIADRGVDWFRGEVERRAGLTLAPARAFEFHSNADRLGWIEGSGGRWHLGLRILSGRIADRDGVDLRSALAAVAREHDGDFRLTPNQNLLIADIPFERRERISAILREHGVATPELLSPLRQRALACVALPTCPLAMAEAERYLPELITRVEDLLARHALIGQPIHLRVSGCPNGCSRPHLAEIALIGKAPGRYNLYLGGDAQGRVLNRLHRENIAEPEILAELDAAFARYAAEREAGEGFGVFVRRAGIVAGPPNIDIRVETVP